MTQSNRIDFEKSRTALKNILLQRLHGVGDFPTPIEGFVLHRYTNGETPKPRIYDPKIIIVAQGKKWVRIGARDIPYGDNSCFIAGINMPVSSCVMEACEERPYLSVSLDLDKSLIAALSAKASPSTTAETGVHAATGAVVQEISPELLDAFLRLLELLDQPDQAHVLGPLVCQEIHYRLLTSPFGGHLRMLNTLGSQSNQISRAIAWLKENFTQTLHVEELANQCNMAPSTFHKHFKEITTLSPLQYQKRLRLTEAQRLMLAAEHDATQAAFAVGYESATQFSREYKRLFGESPRKDVVSMRASVSS